MTDANQVKYSKNATLAVYACGELSGTIAESLARGAVSPSTLPKFPVYRIAHVLVAMDGDREAGPVTGELLRGVVESYRAIHGVAAARDLLAGLVSELAEDIAAWGEVEA